MKLTKYEHACLLLELDDTHLIVDPGAFSMPLDDVGNVVAVVITHEHPDHWTPEQLERILRRNPDARIYGPAGVVTAAADFAVTEVSEGDLIEAGPFALRFFGKKHAVIHSSIPVIDNVGVLINDELFYPGDSFTVPDVEVGTLAAPAGAPWSKISEAIDYVLAVKPRRAFSTHQALLSVVGLNMWNDRLTAATEASGGAFTALAPSESMQL